MSDNKYYPVTGSHLCKKGRYCRLCGRNGQFVWALDYTLIHYFLLIFAIKRGSTLKKDHFKLYCLYEFVGF